MLTTGHIPEGRDEVRPRGVEFLPRLGEFPGTRIPSGRLQEDHVTYPDRGHGLRDARLSNGALTWRDLVPVQVEITDGQADDFDDGLTPYGSPGFSCRHSAIISRDGGAVKARFPAPSGKEVRHVRHPDLTAPGHKAACGQGVGR